MHDTHDKYKELDELRYTSIGFPLGDIMQRGRDETPQPIDDLAGGVTGLWTRVRGQNKVRWLAARRQGLCSSFSVSSLLVFFQPLFASSRASVASTSSRDQICSTNTQQPNYGDLEPEVPEKQAKPADDGL